MSNRIDKVTMDRIELLHPSIREEVKNIYLNEIIPALSGNAICRFAYTLRTFNEQSELYAQGRTKLFDTNGKRLGKVTNANAGQSIHNYGLACFDENTRVLTNNGLKFFYELDGTEEVLSFKNGELRFEKPNAYISNDFDGDMVKVKSRSIDLLITPNHKMIVKEKINNKWSDNWEEITADILSYKHKIPTAGRTIHNSNNIPIFNKYKRELNISNSLDWWEFMGYYLSEGSSCGTSNGIMRKHNNRFGVKISQVKEKNESVWSKINDCLTRLGFTFSYSGHDFIIHNKSLHEVLFPIGNSYNKHIPTYLLYGDYEHLNRLYYALIDGDGSYYDNGEAYFSVSKKLVEDISILAILIGKSVSNYSRIPNINHILPHGEVIKTINRQYIMRSRTKIDHELRNGNDHNKIISNEYYKGVVYCVSVPSGAIVVERNGKYAIAGNCDIVLLVDTNGDGVYESASWDTKKDYDKDNQSDWMEIVRIFKSHGYDWGGDWKFVDAPHFEKKGYNWRTLKAKYDKGDFIKGTKYINL